MDSSLPLDPYKTLGLTQDASPETIKKAYRRLVLRLHPDKCTEESQKAQNSKEFLEVQQAFDLIGDEKKRARNDAQLRLAELRAKEAFGAKIPEPRPLRRYHGSDRESRH